MGANVVKYPKHPNVVGEREIARRKPHRVGSLAFLYEVFWGHYLCLYDNEGSSIIFAFDLAFACILPEERS